MDGSGVQGFYASFNAFMVGDIDETSRVTSSVPSGMLFKDCSKVMKLVVSLMKEGRVSTCGCKW